MLRPQDIVEWKTLSATLERVNFEPNKPDSYIWSPHKTGESSVKSFKTELEKTSTMHLCVPPMKTWKNLVPHRIEIFTWFATLGRLNTREKMVRHSIIPIEEINCILCSTEPESSNHLFLHFPYSWEIWAWWLRIWV